MKKRLQLLAAALLLCGAGAAAEESGQNILSGVVVGDPALLQGTVTLTDSRASNHAISTDLSGDGTFHFHGVPGGQYTLTVLDGHGNPVYQEVVPVSGSSQSIDVRLPRRDVERPPAASVSAAQLLHPPSKKAVDAFVKAGRFSEAGNYRAAAEQLQKAIEISPGYADAWVNLGAQHLRLGDYQMAVEELARANQIAGPTATSLGNMAFAFQVMHRDREAIESARLALQIDSTYAPAHLILGLVLAGDRRTLAEGVAHLEIAARTIPSAAPSLQQARHELTETISHP